MVEILVAESPAQSGRSEGNAVQRTVAFKISVYDRSFLVILTVQFNPKDRPL